MPITVATNEKACRLCAAGELSMASAAELKERLMQALASGRDLDIDGSGVEELDITSMQLLWAAARDFSRGGLGLTGRLSPAALRVLDAAGFEPFLVDRTAEPQAVAVEPQAGLVQPQE